MSFNPKQSHILAIVQARHISLFGHIARMPDEADTKIITASTPGQLEKTTGMSSYSLVEDYSAGPEI